MTWLEEVDDLEGRLVARMAELRGHLAALGLEDLSEQRALILMRIAGELSGAWELPYRGSNGAYNLGRLVDDGFIEARPCRDRRRKRLVLTARGRRAREQLLARVEGRGAELA